MLSLAACAVAATSVSSSFAGQLSVRVIDADTAQPLPARVELQGQDGRWYFPQSDSPQGSAVAYKVRSFSNPNSIEMHTCLSAHPFSIQLNPGPHTLTVRRGKEYFSHTRQIIVANKPLSVEIKLKRWIDMPTRGWYSGDTHVHRTLADLPTVILAEDLNVAFPLLHWVRDAGEIPDKTPGNTPYDPELITVDPTHVIWPRNTEYEIFRVNKKAHTLGAIFILNHKTLLDVAAPPVTPIAQRARNQGALLELDKHNWPWSMMLVPIMNVDLYELSNNHVWRATFGFPKFGEPAPDYMNIETNADGMTEVGWIDYGFQNYYALLNCGFRLRPTAGTASGVHPVPLGFGRVYVHLEGEFEYSSWLEGLNAGRSFVTTGPMLFINLNGQHPGQPFKPADSAKTTYHLTGSALSADPLDRIEIIKNGQLIRTLTPTNKTTESGAHESFINETFEIKESSWLAVRCFELRPDGRPRFAHSAPFHIDVPNKPLRPQKDQIQFLIQRMETQLSRSQAVLSPDALNEYRQALRIYKNIANSAR
jgi:hypothetical protein